MSTITDNEITGYVNFKGPRYQRFDIFRNRNKHGVNRPKDEDVHNACLLDDMYIWPQGILSRSWLTQPQYKPHGSSVSSQRRTLRSGNVSTRQERDT